MVLRGIKHCDKCTDDALGVMTICSGGFGVIRACDKKNPGKVADGGYDNGKVIPAIPKPIVGHLIAKDLGFQDQWVEL